jgi:hypothetical protein
MLGLLRLVLKLAAKHRACYCAHDAVTAELVAAKVASRAATKSTHKTAVTLSLCVGVRGAVLLLARLAVSRLGLVRVRMALGVVVLSIRALLGELALGCASWVALWLTVLTERC